MEPAPAPQESMEVRLPPVQGALTAPITPLAALQPSAATPVPMSLRPELLFEQGVLRRDGGTVVQEAMRALNDAATAGFRTLDLETPLRRNAQTVLLAMWFQRLGALLAAVDQVWPRTSKPADKLRDAWRMYRTQWSGWAQRVDEAALAWMNNVITTPGGATGGLSGLEPLYHALISAAPRRIDDDGSGSSVQPVSYYRAYEQIVRNLLQRLAPDEVPDESGGEGMRDEARELDALQEAAEALARRVRQADQAAAAALMPSAEFLRAMQLLSQRSAAPAAAASAATAALAAQLAAVQQQLQQATQGREREKQRADALQRELDVLRTSASTSATSAAEIRRLSAELSQTQAEARAAKEAQAAAERQLAQFRTENDRLRAANEQARELQRELNAANERKREAVIDANDAQTTLRQVQETLQTETLGRISAQRTIEELRTAASLRQEQFTTLQQERDQALTARQQLQGRVTELVTAKAELERTVAQLSQTAESAAQTEAALATERSARQLAERWLAGADSRTPLPPAAFVEYLRERARVA